MSNVIIPLNSDFSAHLYIACKEGLSFKSKEKIKECLAVPIALYLFQSF